MVQVLIHKWVPGKTDVSIKGCSPHRRFVDGCSDANVLGLVHGDDVHGADTDVLGLGKLGHHVAPLAFV